MHYQVVSGSLPAGLNLNEATGAITGTPTAGSDTETSVVVECRVANYLYGNRTITFAPIEYAVKVEQTEFAVGEAVETWVEVDTIDVPDGAFVSFAVDGLPAGLSIDAETGDITGTPEKAGEYQAVVTYLIEYTTGSGSNARTTRLNYQAPVTFVVAE